MNYRRKVVRRRMALIAGLILAALFLLMKAWIFKGGIDSHMPYSQTMFDQASKTWPPFMVHSLPIDIVFICIASFGAISVGMWSDDFLRRNDVSSVLQVLSVLGFAIGFGGSVGGMVATFMWGWVAGIVGAAGGAAFMGGILCAAYVFFGAVIGIGAVFYYAGKYMYGHWPRREPAVESVTPRPTREPRLHPILNKIGRYLNAEDVPLNKPKKNA